MVSNPYQLHINLDSILKKLFLAYAFVLPFELAFEMLFDIETIFKPFRIVALLIIAAFTIRSLKKGLYFNMNYRSDIFLYLVFVYGILISLVNIVTGIFNFGLFYNDLFQTGLNVLVFFIFKAIPLEKSFVHKVFRSFLLGLVVNAIYIFSEFYFMGHHGRQAGFTDNPNYGSLGLVTGITYLMLNLNYIRQYWKKIAYLGLIIFLIYIFIIEGSRAGLVMLIVSNIFLFFFYSAKSKAVLLTVSLGIILMLIPRKLDTITIGGGPLILISRVAEDINTGQEDVRFAVWRGVFRVLEDRGYQGIGIGQYKAIFPYYYGEETNELINDIIERRYFLSTHNDYLAILTDYGLPSLVLYLVFLFYTLKKLASKMLYEKGDKETEMLNRFSFILFACIILFGMAAENFQHPLYWFILAFATKNKTD